MASPIPSHPRKLPMLTPIQFLSTEMRNPASRLSTNNFIRDVALFVLSPMLEYPLRGYAEPGVFKLNHKTYREGVERRMLLTTPSSKLPCVLSKSNRQTLSNPFDLLIDRLGRFILINHERNCLTAVSQNSSVVSFNIPNRAPSSFFNEDYISTAVDYEGKIYVIDSIDEAIAVFSSEGVFEKHIVSMRTSSTDKEAETDVVSSSLQALSIDLNHLYVAIHNSKCETTLVKYSLQGEPLETLNYPTNKSVMYLSYDPKYNRLYVVGMGSVSYYCFKENLLKEFIPANRKIVYVKLKVDVEGNVYVGTNSGEIEVYNPEGILLSTLLTEYSDSPFALNENGGLCFYQSLAGIVTFDDEAAGTVDQ